jgi:hypothetical protein
MTKMTGFPGALVALQPNRHSQPASQPTTLQPEKGLRIAPHQALLNRGLEVTFANELANFDFA